MQLNFVQAVQKVSAPFEKFIENEWDVIRRKFICALWNF